MNGDPVFGGHLLGAAHVVVPALVLIGGLSVGYGLHFGEKRFVKGGVCFLVAAAFSLALVWVG